MRDDIRKRDMMLAKCMEKSQLVVQVGEEEAVGLCHGPWTMTHQGVAESESYTELTWKPCPLCSYSVVDS